MNYRDPFPAGDPLDRTLTKAFGSRHVPTMSAPSLIDVRHRARRRQQRRTAGLVGAITLVGAGGVGAYAIRHDDGRAALSPGDADANGAPSTTIACLTVATTVPALPTVSTVSGPGVYTVQQGDTPEKIATMFGLSVDDLAAANDDLPNQLHAGGTLIIPSVEAVSSTLPPVSGGCGPDVQWTWHCTGELGTDEFGRQVFESCEQVEPALTTIPGLPVGTTTTFPPQLATSTIAIPPETTTVHSVNGNTDATSTTNVVYESTTTAQG